MRGPFELKGPIKADKDGEFTIRDLAPVTWEVFVLVENYCQPAPVTVKILPDKDQSLDSDLILKPDPNKICDTLRLLEL